MKNRPYLAEDPANDGELYLRPSLALTLLYDAK